MTYDLSEINFYLVRHLSFGFLSLMTKINPDYIKVILQSLCHCLNVFDLFTFHLFFLDSCHFFDSFNFRRRIQKGMIHSLCLGEETREISKERGDI